MNQVLAMSGTPGGTVRIVGTDVSQLLTDTIARDLNGRRVVGALITVEDQTVRCAMGGTVPTQGANQVGHTLVATTTLWLTSTIAVLSFRFINDVAATVGTLQVTPEYEV